MVKWVSAFGLSNDKIAMVDVDGSADLHIKLIGLVWVLEATWQLILHSNDELGKLSQWHYAMITAP